MKNLQKTTFSHVASTTLNPASLAKLDSFKKHGNHEARITRFCFNHPEWRPLITVKALKFSPSAEGDGRLAIGSISTISCSKISESGGGGVGLECQT